MVFSSVFSIKIFVSEPRLSALQPKLIQSSSMLIDLSVRSGLSLAKTEVDGFAGAHNL